MPKKKKEEKIVIKCYGTEKTYTSRSEAIKEFREAADWSEGSERERYLNILMDLYDGKTYCSDTY